MDATFVIPIEYQIELQKILSKFHIDQNKDFLAIETPLWIKIFVIWELIFQLPFFIFGAIDYLRNDKRGFSKFTWPMFILYGFNAGFTSLVCLIYVLAEGESKGLSFSQVLNLAGLYAPTMVLPFIMMVDFWKRVNVQLQKDKKE